MVHTGGRSPLLIFENRKKSPNFGEKVLNCHLRVKFAIQNAVLRVSRTKKLQHFSLWGLFSSVFDEMFFGCATVFALLYILEI